MSRLEEENKRMKAALNNIIDISSDEFSRSQARYGLGLRKHEDAYEELMELPVEKLQEIFKENLKKNPFYVPEE